MTRARSIAAVSFIILVLAYLVPADAGDDGFFPMELAEGSWMSQEADLLADFHPAQQEADLVYVVLREPGTHRFLAHGYGSRRMRKGLFRAQLYDGGGLLWQTSVEVLDSVSMRLILRRGDVVIGRLLSKRYVTDFLDADALSRPTHDSAPFK